MVTIYTHRFSPTCIVSFARLAINYPALNSLLQMFTNNMSLNPNKLPILVPSNTSSHAQHATNPSHDLHEQQQHTLTSPRSPLSSNSNNTSYNTDSSLLMCGPAANSPQNGHLNPNSSLSSSIPQTSAGPYHPAMSPLYASNTNSLSNPSAGEIRVARVPCIQLNVRSFRCSS